MDKIDTYTRNLIDAVVQENKSLAQKMIEHGANIVARKMQAVDAIYIALDLNHLDMLEHILKHYTLHNDLEYIGFPSFVFERYFDLIFKTDNIQALAIFDKYSLIDIALKNEEKEFRCIDMMRQCATQCLLYTHDKFSMGEWIEALSEKIRHDLVVSSYQNCLPEATEHLEFVLNLQKINPQLFQLALANALFEMKDCLYLARPDKKDSLYIMTDYMLAGLNPNQELKDMNVPYIDEAIADNQMKRFNQKVKCNYGHISEIKTQYNFYSLIKYEETRIAVEKFMLEKLIVLQEKQLLDDQMIEQNESKCLKI